MIDIRIDNDAGKFKFRVCGILEHKNKILTVRINKDSHCCLPGGHVELGEDTDHAILREMKEELGYDVKIERLIAINQNFFYTKDHKPFHEIGYYYIVKAVDENNINENNYVREELDKGKIQHLEFNWVTKEELKNIDFRPKFIADCLDLKQTKIITTKD